MIASALTILQAVVLSIACVVYLGCLVIVAAAVREILKGNKCR